MTAIASPVRAARFSKVSLAEALDILCKFKESDRRRPVRNNRHKRYQFVSVMLRTSPDDAMRKKGNRFYGQVEKVQWQRVTVNGDYGTAVDNAQMRESGLTKVDFDSKFIPERSWGVKVEQADPSVAPMLQISIGVDDEETNTPQLYVMMFPRKEGSQMHCHYEWTSGTKRGTALTESEEEEMKTFFYDADGMKRTRQAQRRQNLEKPVMVIKPNIQSLREFRIGGKYYVVDDFAMPKIPTAVYDLALRDVEERRAIKAINEDAKKAAEKAKKDAKKKGYDEAAVCEIGLRAKFAVLVEKGRMQAEEVEGFVSIELAKKGYLEVPTPGYGEGTALKGADEEKGAKYPGGVKEKK